MIWLVNPVSKPVLSGCKRPGGSVTRINYNVKFRFLYGGPEEFPNFAIMSAFVVLLK